MSGNGGEKYICNDRVIVALSLLSPIVGSMLKFSLREKGISKIKANIIRDHACQCTHFQIFRVRLTYLCSEESMELMYGFIIPFSNGKAESPTTNGATRTPSTSALI